MEGGGNGKHSEENKQKMRKPRSEKAKQRMGESKLGSTLSKETKHKISEATKGEKHHKSKRVYQYARDGTFIESYGSAREAGRYLKKSGAYIGECARGNYKTAYNFKWSHVLDIFI